MFSTLLKLFLGLIKYHWEIERTFQTFFLCVSVCELVKKYPFLGKSICPCSVTKVFLQHLYNRKRYCYLCIAWKSFLEKSRFWTSRFREPTFSRCYLRVVEDWADLWKHLRCSSAEFSVGCKIHLRNKLNT